MLDRGYSKTNFNIQGLTPCVCAHKAKKADLEPYLDDISGYSKGKLLFDNIADRLDNHTSPIEGVRPDDALIQLNRNKKTGEDRLIIELPGGERDMGIQPVEIYVPVDLPCPIGTKEEKK